MHQVAHRRSFHSRFDRPKVARHWAEKAVEIARESFSPAILAGSLSNLADIVRINREFDNACGLYEEARRLFQESGDLENATWALSHRGDLRLEEGDPEAARSIYLAALDSFRKINCVSGIASCLHDLGTLAARNGNLAEANSLFQHSLRLYGPENNGDAPRVLESLAAAALQQFMADRALVLLG